MTIHGPITDIEDGTPGTDGTEDIMVGIPGTVVIMTHGAAGMEIM